MKKIKLRIVAMFTLTMFVLGITGCATIPEEHGGAAKGAGLGATAGAVGGALLAGEGSQAKGTIET